MKCHSVLLIAALCIEGAEGGGTVITNGFQNNKDRTPILGRGYSPATGNLLGSCMEVPQATNPSYDYQYKFTEFTSTRSGESDNEDFALEFAEKIGESEWRQKISSEVSSAIQTTVGTATLNFFMSEMEADLYYYSADEASIVFSSDALSLLSRGEIIGFLQGCGPYYIRSIRRVKALVTLFRSVDASSNSTLAPGSALFNDIRLQLTSINQDADESTNSGSVKASASSLTINIFGFGLTMRDDGAVGSLAARSIEDYAKVMDYGFNSMKNPKTGLVRSVEIYPFTANMNFQQAAKLDVAVEKTDCYTLTNRTCTGLRCKGHDEDDDEIFVDCINYCHVDCRSGDQCGDIVADGSTVSTDRCRAQNGTAKFFGYVLQETADFDCKEDAEYNTFAVDYVEQGSSVPKFVAVEVTAEASCTADDIYRTDVTKFPTMLKQFNFISNAEFIVNADATVREMFLVLELMSQCIGILNAYPTEVLETNWVRNQRMPVTALTYEISDVSAPVDQSIGIITNDFNSPMRGDRLLTLLLGDCGTPEECVVARGTDPAKYLYGHQVNSFLLYVEHFYSACLQKFGENDLDFSGGSIFTKHWVQITECAKPECLVKGTSWNTTEAGCTIELGENSEDQGEVMVSDVSYVVDAYCMPILVA
uniref:MACPF domain-containing protein n=1 Tax=Corethron hystrix TaxID=216773 RepID=A0A7S1B8A0_9STRA|mmetsp:Transcript_16376/g.36834  ORF Transcript_16376/g.36834 Transcript_16376/m.36834 type:complete len:649 (+) Transcript_16376:131-2077(+)